MNQSMMKARTDLIIKVNTKAFIDIWERYKEWIQFPLDHLINADETLLRACKDGAKIENLEAK